jgi:zinc finger protein
MRKATLAPAVKHAVVDSICPMCRRAGHLTMLSTTVEVPYFGEGLETTLRCDACGFRHADFMILSQKDPVRLSLACSTEADLSVRVIRSNSGTIRIPELGFLAEPTPLSESFVSNVEGVLERAKDVLLTALEFHGEDPDKHALLDEYLRRFEAFRNARAPFTLVLDDPHGNSAIVSDRVEKRALTPDEVAELKTGMILLDSGDLA